MNQKARDQGAEGKLDQANRTLVETLRNTRYEVVPLKGSEKAVVDHAPRDITLAVTASPNKGIWETIGLTERLCGQGYRVVPHLSARLVENKKRLEEILYKLHESGVRDVFVVAGDAKEPAGEFHGAHALLTAMNEIGHDFEEVGITGYPEGHPFISGEDLDRAMREKAPYATYIVTQICFDTDLISDWSNQVKRRGVELPIQIGLPGYVNRQKLMRISASIGLGESARFLRKQSSWLFKLFLPGGYNPGRLIEDLKPTLVDPQNNVNGLHINTFNDVEKTETWRRKMLESIETE